MLRIFQNERFILDKKVCHFGENGNGKIISCFIVNITHVFVMFYAIYDLFHVFAFSVDLPRMN